MQVSSPFRTTPAVAVTSSLGSSSPLASQRVATNSCPSPRLLRCLHDPNTPPLATRPFDERQTRLGGQPDGTQRVRDARTSVSSHQTKSASPRSACFRSLTGPLSSGETRLLESKTVCQIASEIIKCVKVAQAEHTGKLRLSFDSKLNAAEHYLLQHSKLQFHVFQHDVDNRLRAIEEYQKEHAKKVANFEDRLSMIEESTACLQDLGGSMHHQHVDLKGEVAEIKTEMTDLQDKLPYNSCPSVEEDVIQRDVERKGHINKLTAILEDGNAAMNEYVGGIPLAHEQKHLWQQRSYHRKDLPRYDTNSDSKLCTVEANIALITASLARTENRLKKNRLKNMEWPECRKSNGTASAECQATTKPLQYNNFAAIGRGIADSSENVEAPALIGATDFQPKQATIAQVKHGHSRVMQTVHAKESQELEQVLTLDELHVGSTCYTIMEEPETQHRYN